MVSIWNEQDLLLTSFKCAGLECLSPFLKSIFGLPSYLIPRYSINLLFIYLLFRLMIRFIFKLYNEMCALDMLQNLFHGMSISAQKIHYIHILTRVCSVQHPNPGRNIQHLFMDFLWSKEFLINILCSHSHYKSTFVFPVLFDIYFLFI